MKTQHAHLTELPRRLIRTDTGIRPIQEQDQTIHGCHYFDMRYNIDPDAHFITADFARQRLGALTHGIAPC
jgi:hypothetical protein